MVLPNNLPEFVRRTRTATKPPFTGRLLCFDPGDTTGWSAFQELDLIGCGQFSSVKSFLPFRDIIEECSPEQVVIENYRVYGHLQKQHVGSEVPTIQYVGVLKYLCAERGIPYALQMAEQAKGFTTDARLEMMGLYQMQRRHANDSIRHGVYWLVFG